MFSFVLAVEILISALKVSAFSIQTKLYFVLHISGFKRWEREQ